MGRDKPSRGRLGNVAAALDIHRLEQMDCVKFFARAHAGRETERSEDLGREQADVGKGRLHQLPGSQSHRFYAGTYSYLCPVSGHAQQGWAASMLSHRGVTPWCP